MARWKIYYVDGSTFSHVDGTPADAPGWGVAAVVQEDSLVGVQVFRGNDFYCFAREFDGWAGLDYFGLSQYIARSGTKIIKLGEMMSAKEYRKLVASLHTDPDLPKKSARYEWEQK